MPLPTPTNVTIEGYLGGKLARIYWDNGEIRWHDVIKNAAARVVQTMPMDQGLPFQAGGPMYYKDFYTNPYAFVALIRSILHPVVSISGISNPTNPVLPY